MCTSFAPASRRFTTRARAVVPRDVSVLEHAKRRLFLRERRLGANSLVADDHHLARLHLADIFGVDEIECAGLRRQDVGAVELAENERAKAKGIAHPDDFAL